MEGVFGIEGMSTLFFTYEGIVLKERTLLGHMQSGQGYSISIMIISAKNNNTEVYFSPDIYNSYGLTSGSTHT